MTLKSTSVRMPETCPDEVCREALDLIKVRWEVLPFVLDCREAGKPGAPILRPEMNPDSNMTGNTFGAPVKWEIGNVEKGFKEGPIGCG